MRHSLRENQTVLGSFTTGETVTIALYDLSNHSAVALSDNSCAEVGGSALGLGIFEWNTSNIQAPPTSFKEYLWIMTDSNGNTQPGKIVLGGFPTHVENGAFMGCVWIDADNGVSDSGGDDYPIGTVQYPVDNFTDALAIAQANDLYCFKVRGAITIGAGESIAGYVFKEWGNHASLTLNGSSNLNTVFLGHLHLYGDLNGHAHFHNCHFTGGSAGMTGLEGFFIDCLFDDGNYEIDGGALSRFIRCSSSGQQGQAVVLSCSGSGIDLGIWGWSGKMEIEDKTGSETFDIEMLTGELEIASSCVDGRINVRGVAEVTDNSGAGCQVVTGKLITEQIDSQLSNTHGAGSWLTADLTTVITALTAIQAQTDQFNFESNGDVHAYVDLSSLATQASLSAVATDVALIKKIESGRWKIENNQMIFYDDDDTTPLLTFDLKDVDGAATETNPYERVPA